MSFIKTLLNLPDHWISIISSCIPMTVICSVLHTVSLLHIGKTNPKVCYIYMISSMQDK